MNQYEINDYASALASAEKIKTHADNLMSVFTSIDKVMDRLFGEGWQSTGANQAFDNYMELHKNYDIFYGRIVQMCTNLTNITNRAEESDKTAQNIVTGSTGY